MMLSRLSTVGARRRYNTPAYQLLVRVIAAAAGTDRDDLTRQWLTAPLGMRHTRWIERTHAPQVAGSPMLGLATSPLDLARLGLLVLADGVWDGTRIVSSAGLSESLQTSQPHNPAYGLLWWLNGRDRVLRPTGDVERGPLIPTAPNDLIAALGTGDCKLYVVPSLGLVVARLGAPAGAQSPAGSQFDHELWDRLATAAPR